jgi:WD40 repeat protein
MRIWIKYLIAAVSSDNKYLASGDENKMIYIWECESMTRIHVFRGNLNK